MNKGNRALLGIIASCLLLSTPLLAATPPGGSISEINPTVNWTGGIMPANPDLLNSPRCAGANASKCDNFSLTVSPPSAAFGPYVVEINLLPVGDWDVEVYAPDGTYLKGSGGGTGAAEFVLLDAPAAGTYRVAAFPFSPAVDSNLTSYTANAQLKHKAPSAPATGTENVSYGDFPCPTGQTCTTGFGEPSIGVNWKTGTVIFAGGGSLKTYKINFNDQVAPSTATWTNVGVNQHIATSPRLYADPILFTDSKQGRTFAGQLEGLTPFCTTEYTDDDGATWIPSQGSGIAAGIDHQTYGGGPLAAPLTRDPNLPRPAYPNGVYYCAQSSAGPAQCAISLDGGQTFGPSVPMWTTECGGLHGHIKVAPDGTAYVPNKSCTGRQSFAVSSDNGQTWAIRMVPGSAGGDSDPSIGIGADGTVYFGFCDGDGHPKIAVTHDKGLTWDSYTNGEKFTDVGTPFGIKNSVFAAVVAGDPDRAAFAFHGTPTAGPFQDASFTGVWDLYVAQTYDGGRTWTTVKASPDPVQRGCIWLGGGSNPCRNLLDFFDATVDEAGRVVVGYADGCTGACATDPANTSKSVWATIARQSNGKRMLAQFDPPATNPAGTLQLSAASYSTNEGSGTATITVSRTGGSTGAVSVNYATSNGTAAVGSDYTAASGTLNWTDGDSVSKTFTVAITDDTQSESSETVNVTLSAPSGGATIGSPSSAVLTIIDNDAASVCSGVPVATDPSGDQTGGAQLDVQSLTISEPYTTDADKSVTFKLNVANLATPIPPNGMWIVGFTANDTTGTARNLFVQMDTTGTQNLDPTTPEFDYGYSDGSQNTTQGNGGGAVTGSFTSAGVITMKLKAQSVLSFSDFTGAHQFDVSLNPGMVLSNVEIFSQTLVGAVGNGGILTNDASDNNGGTRTYTLRGNLSCKPTTGSTPTTTSLTSSLNPSNSGQSVTLTATVAPSAATGSVTFKDGAATLGTGTLAGGTATFTTSALSAGTHSLTATYGGNTTYAPSASASITQTVNQTLAGTPRFDILQAPPGLGDGWGEPSIGVNWQSEKVFSNSAGSVANGGTIMSFGGFGGGANLTNLGAAALRVTCSDCPSPADAVWEKSASLIAAGSPRVYGDPILFTDHDTGRTFISQLFGLTPLSSGTDFTDDDGKTILPTVPTGIPSGLDHQAIAGGPYHAPIPAIPPGTVYPNAVYYCSQDLFNAVPANCSLSVDGGLTWGPPVPTANTGTQCGGGIHGHVKVGPDGTVFVPHRFCSATGTTQGLVISKTNGMTWTSSPIPGTSNGNWDPSVAIGKDGAIYFGMDGQDRHARIATSHDGGVTWSAPVDVGATFNIQLTAFPAVVAGDPGRAAFAFLGTPTSGDDQSPAFNGEWHLYLATTFDGGQSWSTSDLTPNDPVQRGAICAGGPDCTPALRNLLDFFDATIDKEGRVVIGYADGCITQQCINGGPNDATAKNAIARQSGGKRMFSAFDPVEPSAPKAPAITANLIGNTNKVSWSKPDHSGSPVTSYKLYRRSGNGPFNLLAVTSTNNYDDTNVPANSDYAYRVTAVNALGEGPSCGFATPVIPADSCHRPGLLTIDDLNTDGSDSDSGQNTPPDARVNIQRLYVAEPELAAGETSKLEFTLYVKPSATLTTAPPNSQWFIIWNRAVPDADFDRLYVAMKSDATGAVSFEYGKFGVPTPIGGVPSTSTNQAVRSGAADSGSYDAASGKIVITLSTSKAENVMPGQSLTALNARTFIGQPEQGLKSQSAASDITANGIYTLVGNCVSNHAPVAANDSYVVAEDNALSVAAPGVLANDTDADNNPLTATLVTGTSHGSVSLNANGSFTYTPQPNYNGADSFTYKASDGSTNSNVATVSITVSPVNDPPVAANDAYTTAEDTALTVNAPGVLANDADVDGNALAAVLVTGPAHGTLSLNANGSFTYTPASNYNGADSFTYKANDGSADSNVATVSITVTAVNDPPVANNDSYSTKVKTTRTVAAPGVLANDGDVDSASMTARLVSGPSHGTLTFNSDGSFVYTPATTFQGVDTFTYVANDGQADSNVATVSITVDKSGQKVKMTGAGEVSVFNPDGTASFGLDISRSADDAPPTGSLNYYNPGRNLTVQSSSITSLDVVGTKATFTGTCTKNGAPCTFTATVEDNGEPGRGRDRFTIAVSGEPVEGGTAPITSGNVQIK